MRSLPAAVMLVLVACDERPLRSPHTPTRSAEEGFDREAASVALGAFGADIRSCRDTNDPPGSGHVTFTFEPDGVVSNATLDAGPFIGTATGVCVVRKAFPVRVPPFKGAAVRVGKSFRLE